MKLIASNLKLLHPTFDQNFALNAEDDFLYNPYASFNIG